MTAGISSPLLNAKFAKWLDIMGVWRARCFGHTFWKKGNDLLAPIVVRLRAPPLKLPQESLAEFVVCMDQDFSQLDVSDQAFLRVRLTSPSS